MLDLGSGRGDHSAMLARAGRRPTLMDWSPQNIEFSRQMFAACGVEGRFCVGDITRPLPFDSGSFDAVFSCGVLEYFDREQVAAIIGEAFRVARKRVIVLVPNAFSVAYRVGKWYMERSGTWTWGGEVPSYSLKSTFEGAGAVRTTELTVAARHSLDFLVMPLGSQIKRACIKLLRMGHHVDPGVVPAGLSPRDYRRQGPGAAIVRVCVFGPDLPAFEQKRLRLLAPVADGPDVETVLLTNSRGRPPADGTHVHVTAGANTGSMRALRWLLARQHRAPLRAAAALVSPLTAPLLVEGLRAADPDVIVALDPIWASELRTCIRRYRLPWPCLATGEPLPASAGSWRRYDPELKVSIVLPTYNGTKYLAQSLESCFTQTHHTIEVVVVDDGSGPEVAEIVGRFSGPRLKYVRHEVNRGLPAALNTGFAEASGTLLTWTSDDNFYTPGAIEQMTRFLCTYPDVDFVYSDAYEIDAEGKVVGMLWVPPPEWLRVKNRVGGSFMYRRGVYQAIGDYDSGAVLAEDYDYWLRVARKFTMQRLFRALYYYRYHPRSLTARCARQHVTGQAERVRRANRRWWRRSRVGGAT